MVQYTLGKLHEQTANIIIADWLNTVGRSWIANGERRQSLIGNAGRPDVTIRQLNRRPVVIESEYGSPAVGDAQSRLGQTLVGEIQPFNEAIAIGIDKVCESDTNIAFRARLDNNQPILTVQLVSGPDPDHCTIWPSRPIPATPADLAAYCEYAQVPQSVIDQQSADIAERVTSAGIQLLESINSTGNLAVQTIQNLLGLTGVYHKTTTPNPNDPVSCPDNCGHSLQAANTACAVWLIAIDLQNDLAVHSQELQNRGLTTTNESKRRTNGTLLPSELLKSWEIIEGVNYLPVMDTAIATLKAGEMGSSLPAVLQSLDSLSERLNALQAKHIYNFAGELWQRLVADREERAAHYTKPEVAEMLATLAAERFNTKSPQQLMELNIWDGACGTGTLIGAGERANRRLYLLKGGRDPELHRHRMEERIYAMDVNGIAGTLTAKRLTDMDVTADYEHSKIAVVTHEAGSLYLLDRNLTTITEYLGQGGRAGVTSGLDGKAGPFGINPGGVDWALMNPPYSRPRKDRLQATTGLAPLRRKAAATTQNIPRGYTMSNGQAGLASDFSNAANIRLAPEGVYSFVLPMTAAHSESWQSFRSDLESDFEGITVIANTGTDDKSMSADTNMNEILVVATKKSVRPANWAETTITAINLHAPPQTLEQGYAIAKSIATIRGQVSQGRFPHGNWTKTQTPAPGFPWFAVGNANNELTAVATALMQGKCWDPAALTDRPLKLSMAKLGQLASAGPTHDRIGHPEGGDGRGAFKWSKINEDDPPLPQAHQSMWAADSNNQQSIMATPTHTGEVVDQNLAQEVILYRSRYFFSQNLRWTSQATAAVVTAQPYHGGNAWNALQGLTTEIGQAISIFYNSIFGAIIRTVYAQSTQPGRALMRGQAIAGIPCPNFSAGTPEAQQALTVATQEFPRLAKLTLEPFAYCFQDKNRHEIDLVTAQMLGLDITDPIVTDMLAYYRLIFASEPNVNGRTKNIVKAIKDYQK